MKINSELQKSKNIGKIKENSYINILRKFCANRTFSDIFNQLKFRI